ncbi:hypothetical protein PVAND_015292 [Polypedilum vanderplanki]|uniref:Cytochrome P450 n=1 Tax=Polypedilum vanderplanki TaxID=319348 RepID=A0A9J6BC78_POLVA|nr:hypothetical protein PVAND_015292 [Polypedilum vanderplanki]
MWFQIALVFLCIYLWFRNRYEYFKRLGIPFVPPTFPYGSSSTVSRTEHIGDVLRQQYEKFKNQGPAFGTFIFAKPLLVPTDPELVKEIFVRNFESFHDHGFIYNEKVDPLSANLFFKNGQEWKDLRNKLSPTFTSGRMKMMFPLVLNASNRLIDYLVPYAEKSKPFEVKEVYSSFTTEVISDVAFGITTKCLGNPNNDFRKMARAVFEPNIWESMRVFFVFSFEKLAMFLNMSFNPKHVTEFFMGTVRDTLNYREKNKVERNDFFQLLMNIKNSPEGMSFNEVAANSFVFMVAGFETSSSVLTFTSYELALNQDIQDKLRNEINEVLANHNGEITYDAIMEMKYLDMVFNESLRKYPGVDSQNRKATKDFTIPNTNITIPAGTSIMISSYALHNDERFWENPEKFDPDRFLPENVHKRHPFCYIPFSEGPRQCIGLRFGQMQSKIGIVNLIKNFRILPCSKTIIPMKFSPTAAFQSPVGGMWLKFEKL